MQDLEPANWDLYRVFLSLAATGSLTRTAGELKISLPTVSRRIVRLERTLDVRLFDRTRDGYALTDSGKSLRPAAEQVAQAVHDAERGALALRQTARETVRISCGHWVARYLLAELPGFRREHPRLILEFRTTADIVSLGNLEADVALRNVRPEKGRLKIRKLASMDHAIYAAPAYVQRNTISIDAEDWGELDWIGPADPRQPAAAWLAEQADIHPSIRCSATRNLLDAARAALGLVLLPRFVGDSDECLACVSGPVPLPNRDLWLVVHEDLAVQPAIKAVCAWLTEALGRDTP